MKNVSKNDKILFFVISLFISGFVFYQIKNNDDFNKLKNNFALTRGQITYYFSPKLKGSISSLGKARDSKTVRYLFSFKDIVYYHEISENPYVEIPNVKPSFDISYLVIMEVNNPKNSYILFNYPIIDEKDFLKYKLLFSDGIPRHTFKR